MTLEEKTEKESGFFSIALDKIEKAAHSYFKTRKHERKFYEALGIKFFQKFYLATSGRVVSTLANNKDWIGGSSDSQLKRYDKVTRVYETIHLAGNSIFIPMIIYNISDSDYQSAVQNLLVNTVVNVYPIILQRYNRARIEGIINKRKKKA